MSPRPQRSLHWRQRRPVIWQPRRNRPARSISPGGIIRVTKLASRLSAVKAVVVVLLCRSLQSDPTARLTRILVSPALPVIPTACAPTMATGTLVTATPPARLLRVPRQVARTFGRKTSAALARLTLRFRRALRLVQTETASLSDTLLARLTLAADR